MSFDVLSVSEARDGSLSLYNGKQNITHAWDLVIALSYKGHSGLISGITMRLPTNI